MKNKYEKKKIYARTLISLLLFYLITMMIFTVIYEQIVVSRTAFANSNKLSNAVYMAQKSIIEYEADSSLVNLMRFQKSVIRLLAVWESRFYMELVLFLMRIKI